MSVKGKILREMFATTLTETTNLIRNMFKNTKKERMLIIGPPGSGRTALANQISTKMAIVHVSTR